MWMSLRKETEGKGYLSRAYCVLGTWLGPVLMLFNLNPTKPDKVGVINHIQQMRKSWTKKGYNILFKFIQLKSGYAGIQEEAL